MKTPLLLLHGALGSAAQFDLLRKHLPEDWNIHTLNFPGHGGTTTDRAFSIEYFAEYVLAFLDQHNLTQVQVFGYSMGGYVGLYLAWKYPERIQKVITLGTKFAWSPEIAARETALLNPDKIAQKIPVFADLLANRHAPEDWQKVVRSTADLMHELGNGAALNKNAFQSIQCPVCVGLGELDNMVTPEESQQTTAFLAAGTFEILPDTKHPFEQTAPQQIAGWLTRTLDIV